MTRFTCLRAATVLLAVCLPACHFGDAGFGARETIVEARALDPTGEFRLENVNGSITVETGDRDEVRIEAEKAAASSDALERLRVETDGEGERVSVRTRHARASGWLLGWGSGGKVDYRITLPARARVELETVNGRVEVDGLEGPLRVESVNGGVRVRRAASEVEASTVNGSLSVAYRRADPEGRHRFSTTNGSIEVSLPEGTGGRLKASTVNGSVSCDLPLEGREKGRRRLEGRLGPGGGSFELGTVNGSIRVRRAAKEDRTGA